MGKKKMGRGLLKGKKRNEVTRGSCSGKCVVAAKRLW